MTILNKYTTERYTPNNRGSVGNEHLHRYIYSIEYVKSKTVLDIACGEGYGSYLLSKYAKKVISVDIDQMTIESALSKYEKSNIDFLLGSAISIPVESSSMDVVVSFETIEHHSEHEQMMIEIKRVLKNDGILILSTPDKKKYSDDREYVNKYHIRELYTSQLNNLINKYFQHSILLKQGAFNEISYIRQNINDQEMKNITGNLNEISIANQEFLYNIILASEKSNISAVDSNFYYRNDNGIIFYDDYEKGRRNVIKTYSFKIGYYILSPLRFMRKLIMNI
jgi:ubiquinone/menaquinone biosynthesis C-methylase UbiE